jgi:hypothetical protein
MACHGRVNVVGIHLTAVMYGQRRMPRSTQRLGLGRRAGSQPSHAGGARVHHVSVFYPARNAAADAITAILAMRAAFGTGGLVGSGHDEASSR